jgi:hypothetical protein
MESWISPEHKRSDFSGPFTVDDLVKIYDARARGWFLKWVEELHPKNGAGFAALQLALSYFEHHAILYQGNRSSNKKSVQLFTDGFLSVFPPGGRTTPKMATEIAVLVYKDARCGLFHQGITGPRVVLLDHGVVMTAKINPTTGKVEAVAVDIHKFVERIEEHSKQYISRLRDPNETALRQRFKEGWIILHTPKL